MTIFHQFAARVLRIGGKTPKVNMTPPYRDLLPLVFYESGEKPVKVDVMPKYRNSKSRWVNWI